MKKQLNISLDEHLIEYLKKERKIRNRNISNLIETILLDYLKEQGVELKDV
jgi:hypothetical protein